MRKLIFILEDNEELIELYELILAEDDYEITTFTSVAAFMQHFNEIPDLYLLDVMLPDGDGVEVCKLLKQNPKSAAIPVVMISAHQHVNYIKEQCPGSDFISKPFDIDHLREQIAKRVIV